MFNYCYFVCSDFVSQIWTLVFLSIVEAFVYLANLGINSQIQHPRQRIDHFDLIVTPLHDYYALSPMGRQEVPRLLLPWLSPRQPPDKHVVLNISQVCPVCCMKAFCTHFWDSQVSSSRSTFCASDHLLIADLTCMCYWCHFWSLTFWHVLWGCYEFLPSCCLFCIT